MEKNKEKAVKKFVTQKNTDQFINDDDSFILKIKIKLEIKLLKQTTRKNNDKNNNETCLLHQDKADRRRQRSRKELVSLVCNPGPILRRVCGNKLH